MINKKISESSKISLNYDLIRSQVERNISMSSSPKNKKITTLFSLLCILLIPLIAIFLIIFVVNIICNLIDRYSEGNKKFQEEYISSFVENDILLLDALYGNNIYWYNDDTKQFAEFQYRDSVFGEYYSIEYSDGKIREYPNNEYVEVEHDYSNSAEFYRDIFEIELNVSEYDMHIEYLNDLTKEQNTIKVTCILNGDNQLVLNYKYKNEKIIINDVVIGYNYCLNEDSYNYPYNSTLHLEIMFTYDGKEYILYGRKFS